MSELHSSELENTTTESSPICCSSDPKTGARLGSFGGVALSRGNAPRASSNTDPLDVNRGAPVSSEECKFFAGFLAIFAGCVVRFAFCLVAPFTLPPAVGGFSVADLLDLEISSKLTILYLVHLVASGSLWRRLRMVGLE